MGKFVSQNIIVKYLDLNGFFFILRVLDYSILLTLNILWFFNFQGRVNLSQLLIYLV